MGHVHCQADDEHALLLLLPRGWWLAVLERVQARGEVHSVLGSLLGDGREQQGVNRGLSEGPDAKGQ